MPGAHKTVGKMLAAKPGDLSSVIPGTHSEKKGETGFLQVVL